MDVENVNSWASQPDVCRCCLSASGSWDLTASYVTDNLPEIFAEMIRDCFGFTLSYLTEWGPSRMICQLCTGHLRSACVFKKKVLEAEQHFIDVYERKKADTSCTYETKIKEEIKSEFQEDDHYCSSLDNICDVEHKNDNTYTRSIDKSKINRRRRNRTKFTAKKKRKVPVGILEDTADSDTPISELSKKYSNLEGNTIDMCKQTAAEEIVAELSLSDMIKNVKNVNVGVPNAILKSSVKQLSERKRVMLTCGIVLRETNACPFRHRKSWFQCFFCVDEFMEINLLRNHMSDKHRDVENELKVLKRYPRSLQIDISLLKCLHCSQSLNDVDEMRLHFEETHQLRIYNECIADYKVNTSPYTCHICNYEFHMFRSLTTHLNEHYANCICDVCGKSFINTKRLKVHKRTHESGSFPCGECGKVLKTRTSKANHVESVHSKRILKCHICMEPMKHYNDRIKHMSEVHNITHTFKCPICSREYNIKHYLATHMRQTHGHKNKKCSECGMAFITNHGLKKHMLKHTGEKPYNCSVCSKSYARNYTLREHMRTHESDAGFLINTD